MIVFPCTRVEAAVGVIKDFIQEPCLNQTSNCRENWNCPVLRRKQVQYVEFLKILLYAWKLPAPVPFGILVMPNALFFEIGKTKPTSRAH